MSYEVLFHYKFYDSFRELDDLDVKIIEKMIEIGPRNVSEVARALGKPHQTISYRVNRMKERKLVRFRIAVNEEKLGLRCCDALARIDFGKQDAAEEALTPVPLWRFLATLDGPGGHTCFVRYAIPEGTLEDLRAYLQELIKKGFIKGFEIFETGTAEYPRPNLSFYIGGARKFAWSDLIGEILNAEPSEVKEPKTDEIEFDLKDLFLLSELELDAKQTFTLIAKKMEVVIGPEEISLVPWISRRYKELVREDVIKGHRALIFPTELDQCLLLTTDLEFNSESSLGKFISCVTEIPHQVRYEKLSNQDRVFLQLALPAYEFGDFRSFLSDLSSEGILTDASLYVGDLSRVWDNVQLYKAHRNGRWQFSHGSLVKALNELLEMKPG